ncbi:MAG TPA: carboxypeptidase regulatory-like domain-containing protein [Candidatus Acidoferrales bacterium]|nr:carboxypeptidase regulatory-like domain-containing protein [Candidatus Acidoferrales bacterium]
MPGRMLSRRAVLLLCVFLSLASAAFAQFTASIQGVVQDQSGAGVAKATVVVTSQTTGAASTTTTDAEGNYRFVSLAPGEYKITATAAGFAKSEADITLLTAQNLNVPISLKVGSVSDSVQVSTEAPVVDSADSRVQLTIENQAVAVLPIVGRNLVTLVTVAPGVSGLGTSTSGSPASGVDNYSTEEQVDASANGQGQNNNQYVVDGLDVTSGIRQGVLNLTPQPEAIQETSIQVNTFSSEYSRAAGLQTMFTTRSGTDKFHGSAADWFNYQGMFAAQHFVGYPYSPFHSNNMDFGIGGPVIPHHDFFFYFAVEPLRSSSSAGGSVTFAAPEFIQFAQATPALANTVGTGVLAKYLPVGVSGVTVSQTASDVLGSNVCGTPVANNIPCSTPMIDTGSFGATSIRNGTQYFARLDKGFKNDRVYASIFRTLLLTGAPSPMPQFSALNNTWQVAGQASWTHTFSPSTLNDFTAGQSRVEGVLGSGAKDYTVPSISVSGINVDSGQAFGVGFAQGDFIQHNYHWRDVLTHVRGAHTFKFGYEGWYGDDVEPFQGPWSQPKFSFSNLLTLAQDAPSNENGIYYNPATGTEQLWSWDAASRTFGLFMQDTWKAKKNLTVTLGLRYDDSGNPWSKSPSTVFGNFYLGTGSTEQQQVANGYAKATHNALLHSVDNLFSPRIGIAWDPTGSGDWVVRGGFGIYNNWLTQANVQEEFRGSPPGEVAPTFVAGGTASAQAPIFVLGSSDKPPFGFTFPTFGTGSGPNPQSGGGLNAQGGVVGASFAIGGINPLLKSPKSNVWSVSLERKLGAKFAASVGYNGSHSYNIVGNGNSIGNVSYGVDINSFPGDLINVMNTSPTPVIPSPTRLNPSFGPITYADNDRYGNYAAVIFDLRGRFSRGYVDTSYTRSRSKDDALYYPNSAGLDPQQYYGPSIFDVPNRFSLSGNYSLKGLNGGKGFVGYLTGGWGISGTSIFQSGYPLTANNTNGFLAVCASGALSNVTGCSASDPAVAYQAGSGNYNADGETAASYPDATSYTQSTDNKSWLSGAIPKSDFAVPTFGQNGNEKAMQFRGPNFFETDINFYKDTMITERVNFQFRFEVFNIFNRANYANVDTNFPDGNFGFATASHEPRFWQLGGRLSF